MHESIKSNGKLFGLYLGCCLTLLSLIAYFFNLDLYVNFWFGISIYFLAITFGIISIIKTKIDLNGFLSFKNTFAVYFLTIIIGLLITSFINYILFNFIDPNTAEIIKEKSIEKAIETLKSINRPEADIKTIINTAKSENLYSITNVLKGLVMNQLILLSIVGLLVSTALKKNETDTK